MKKEAKKVAVLRVAQAIKLLKLFEIYVPDFEQQQPEDSTPEPATATCPEDVSDWEPQEESGCLQQPPTPAPAATIWEKTSLTETVDETFTEPPPCKFVKLAADQRKSVKQLELSANPTVAVEMLELKRFWTAEANHKRRCKAISHDTFTKTRERLQCECVNCSATVIWCDISVKNRYPGCNRSKLHASVRNFMQAFVTSCKRFKNFMQAVQNFMQAVPKLYASGPKLYASLRNFMQTFVTSCKRS